MGQLFLQAPSSSGCVLDGLRRLILDEERSRLRAAVAFAGAPGVELLVATLAERSTPMAVEVVVGLDGGITRRRALERLVEEFDGVRGVRTPPGRGMFHPKTFVVDVVDRPAVPARAMIGSANLTGPALTRNSEAVAVVALEADAVDVWETWWASVLDSSFELTPAEIEAYEERRPLPGRREVIADEVVEDDGVGGDLVSVSVEPTREPEAAELLCIDVQLTGAAETQLEIPRVPARFFRGIQGQVVSLEMVFDGHVHGGNELGYYGHNSMWRINLTGEIPPVGAKRIRGRTMLFRRISDERYELELIDRERKRQLLSMAALTGGGGHTTRKDGSWREFGWM